MKDISTALVLDNDDRIASGSVKVVDYEKFVGVKATGTITVDDYKELIGVKASATITITDYKKLAGKAFTIGDDTVTDGVDFTAGTANSNTATSLASAIDALTDYSASADGAVVTILYKESGRTGNGIVISSDATAGYTADPYLAGGLNEGTVTIGTTDLVQGTDFTAGTDEDTTATSLAAAINGISGLGASAVGAVISIEADAVGVASNLAMSATWDNINVPGLTLSGSALEGGVDQGTFTFGTTVLTQGTDFTAATGNTATADSLKDAITAISGFTATINAEDDTQIDIVADAEGTAGNASMSTNASEAVEITAMTGGADYFYSDILEYDLEDNAGITVTVEVTVLEAASTLKAYVETSHNKVDWDVIYTFDTFTAATKQEKTLGKLIKSFSRVKIETTGDATVRVDQQTSEYGGSEEPVDIKEETYTTKIEEGETYTYIGVALPGTATSASNWQIKRITNATGDVTWADAVSTFTKEWDERLTYSYS